MTQQPGADALAAAWGAEVKARHLVARKADRAAKPSSPRGDEAQPRADMRSPQAARVMTLPGGKLFFGEFSHQNGIRTPPDEGAYAPRVSQRGSVNSEW
jgi:hypothetical protein